MSEAKKPRGRPSAFNGLDMRQVEILAKRGFTDSQLADFYGVDESTWTRWKQKHPKFCTSLKDWKAEADLEIERCLYEKAKGWRGRQIVTASFQGEITIQECDVIMPPDTTAIIYWLKNRMRDKWRDKPEELATDDKPEVTVIE